MASIEFEGQKVTFEDGECICEDADLQAFGQLIIDGIPGYFPGRENAAVEELAMMGGVNISLSTELQTQGESELVH